MQRFVGAKTRLQAGRRRSQRTQAEGDGVIGSFGAENEGRSHVEILCQQSAKRSERLFHAQMARTDVDDVENRFAVGNGELPKVAVMSEDDSAFGERTVQ